MKLTYVVVFERAPNNFCAYVPDLPGCVSTGRTWEEMLWMMKEAIEFHIEGIQLDGDPIPPPSMSVQEALEYHRSIPNDYGGFFPDHEDDEEEDEDPYAFLEIEVEVNLEVAPASTLSSPGEKQSAVS